MSITIKQVGGSDSISRAEMRDLLLEMPIDLPHASTICARYADGTLRAGGTDVPAVRINAPDLPPSMRAIDAAATREAERQAVAREWANMCQGSSVVSVLCTGYYVADGELTEGLGVRYDQPGSMAPGQHATLAFVSASQEGDECRTIDYIRDHADRVLIVRDDAELPDPADALLQKKAEAAAQSRLERLRRVCAADGAWIRVFDDGSLELREADGEAGLDPAKKSRHQYRMTDEGGIEYRHLPAEMFGDTWQDVGRPEWELISLPPRNPTVCSWWEEQVL